MRRTPKVTVTWEGRQFKISGFRLAGVVGADKVAARQVGGVAKW